jgi:type I restriction-modification system DNA methylase subunit
METFLLKKVRLSYYFFFFFILYAVLTMVLPRYDFAGPALTIFSVNSFLYGFYISPILSAQKARIEELHKIIRSESNAIFAMMLSTQDMPDKLRNEIQAMFNEYIQKNVRNSREAAEKEYEDIISFCLGYKGEHKDEVRQLLEKVVANQQNRTMLNMQLANKVYSNEWIIMMMLFSITLSFILFLNTGDAWEFRLVTALLCTGLSMLILILVKLSTLTHKKAKQMWLPMNKLADSHFYRVD